MTAEKARFSSHVNDLLFWGVHILLIVVCMGAIWSRLDATTKVMLKLVNLQNSEITFAKEQTELAKQQEAQKAKEVQETRAALDTIIAQQKSLMDSNETSMQELLRTVNHVESDVASSLEQIKLISKSVVGSAEHSQQKAIDAQGAALNAKAQANVVKGALAQKKKQLKNATKVITKEKKKNFVQRIFQPIGQ
jgi:beta-galactosidase/beta-glucuronidase